MHCSVLDFFKINDEMLPGIAEQTNLCVISSPTPASMWKQVPHDAAEVRKFIAITIEMGLVLYHIVCSLASHPCAILT